MIIVLMLFILITAVACSGISDTSEPYTAQNENVPTNVVREQVDKPSQDRTIDELDTTIDTHDNIYETATVVHEHYKIDDMEFETAELYTAGSNQQWALWALSQLDNSVEKIRLYDFLLRAHSFLMLYENQDFTEQYYSVKNNWLDAMSDFDAESRSKLQLMLDDENWLLDIGYPLESPFLLDYDEFITVYSYFSDANPQFFLNRIVPATMQSDEGLIPLITIPAYYAFANRRQEAYRNITVSFNRFKSQMEQSIDMSNELYIVKYVYDYVINTLRYNFYHSGYLSRERHAAETTIMGFFGNENLTICKGYSVTIMYLLNRLGIPTIDMAGAMIVRDECGDITDKILHAWNIVNLNDEWFFLDATWEVPGDERRWFLHGRGENNDSYFLHWRAIAEEMIYPEVAISGLTLFP